jgi:uncharacterized membrane-anchored protein
MTTQITTPAVETNLSKMESGAYRGIRIYFAGAVALQIVLLGALAVPSAYTLATGKDVTLIATPVDPYDMFRGEYAQISYRQISNLKTINEFKYDQRVYVSLKNNGTAWIVDSVDDSMPKASADKVTLAGTAESSYHDYDKNGNADLYATTVSYGIERVYTPEGKSAQLQNRNVDVKVDIAVDASGKACIRRVFANDQKVYDVANIFGAHS